MAKIAILDDSPEIVALVAHALTPAGHEVMKMVRSSRYMANSLDEFQPELVIVPLHRREETANRPIEDYRRDIQGTEVLELVSHNEACLNVPVILLGFFTSEADMPEEYRQKVRYDEFLVFPIGLQELNPLVTGLLHHRNKADQENIERPPPP